MFMASKGVHSGPHLQTQCSTAISHNWVWFITTRNCWFSAMVHDWTSIVNELVTFISAVSYPLWAPQYFTRTHRVLGKNLGLVVWLYYPTQPKIGCFTMFYPHPRARMMIPISYIFYIILLDVFFGTSSPRNLPRSDPWQPGFLYYTSNSGYLASGSLTAFGGSSCDAVHSLQRLRLGAGNVVTGDSGESTWWGIKKRRHTMDKFMIINVIWVYYNNITINRGVWY